MAEQNFDVMISSKEYNQLRNYKKEHVQLTQKAKNLAAKLKEALADATSHKDELNKKTLENSYLLQLIQTIVNVQLLESPPTLETAKSVSFEVLGQSIFQPEKAQERKFNTEIQEYNKKYSTVIQKIVIFNTQQQSKDEQIAQLKQAVSQRNQTIAKLQAISVQAGDKKAKEMLQLEKTRADKKNADIQAEVQVLKMHIAQKEAQLKRISNENANLQKQNKNNKILAEKHKDQNNKLSGLLKDFSDRTKILEKEVETLKKKGSNPSPKIEAIVRIKALIDEHVREVQKNLKSIEGLSHEEIANLLRLEMKELIEYISKSIQNKQ